MIIPKRFKVHEAATSELRLSSSGFIARGHAAVVSVPVLEPDQRPGEDVPRLERDERRMATPVDPRAVQEATRGTKGTGTLRLHYDGERVDGAMACSGEGKPWALYAKPDTDQDEHEDSVKKVFAEASLPPARERWSAEVCLNAEVLAQVAAAIGAADGEVRIKFHVHIDTGRCDTERGLIEVRPVCDPFGAYGVLMAVAVP